MEKREKDKENKSVKIKKCFSGRERETLIFKAFFLHTIFFFLIQNLSCQFSFLSLFIFFIPQKILNFTLRRFFLFISVFLASFLFRETFIFETFSLFSSLFLFFIIEQEVEIFQNNSKKKKKNKRKHFHKYFIEYFPYFKI